MIGSLIRRVAGAAGYDFRMEYPALLAAPHSRLGVTPSLVFSALALYEEPVTFIQVGANDGVRADPIRRFVLARHWRGLLVEPDPNHYAKLIANYAAETQLVFLNAAVGSGKDTSFYYVDPAAPDVPDWAFGLGSFDKAVLLRHATAYPDIAKHVRERIVPTITANQMFERFPNRTVNLLLVDVEGYDAEVIQGIDLRKWRPHAIVYESKHLTRARHDSLLRHLIESGYLISVGGGDSVAVLPELF